MNNLLLIFLNELEKVEELNNIIKLFDDHNYIIYILNNIKEDDNFSIDSLPQIVNNYRLQHNEVNSIAVLSNSRDLMTTWFRCYNSLVDHFIYFIDANDKNYFNKTNLLYDYINCMNGFQTLDRETIEGKLYLNLNFSNSRSFLNPEIVFKYYYLYDVLENFPFNQKSSKTQLEKKYIYKGLEYYFQYNTDIKQEIIRLGDEKTNNINIDSNYIANLLNSYHSIPFIVIFFHREKNVQLNTVIIQLFFELKKKGSSARFVFKKLLDYISNDSKDPFEQLYIFSLLNIINDGTNALSNVILKIMENSNLTVDICSEIISNLQFYQAKDNLKLHEEYYLKMSLLINRLSKKITKHSTIQLKRNRAVNENNVVIIVDQLLLKKHSPTKMVLDYANSFIKHNPNYKIKIFVEDNLYSNNHHYMPYSYTSINSIDLREEHSKYINSSSIEIIYPDMQMTKEKRIISFYNEIMRFSPKCVISTSKISILGDLVYDYLPVIYLTLGGINLTRADIILTGNPAPWLEIGKKTGLFDETSVMLFNHGFTFEEKSDAPLRIPLELINNKFVMTTVGNRLESELPPSFIEYIVKFIKGNSDSVWVIVGTNNINYIQTVHNNLISNNRIIFVDYESNLRVFYEKCAVYLNPPSPGRGFSIAMAMKEGVPIISLHNSGGTKYIGDENLCGTTYEDYTKELNTLYLSHDYRYNKSLKMIDRINKKFSMENAIKSLENYMNNAVQLYEARINKR